MLDRLTTEGKRMVQVLVNRYGMTEEMAIQLLKDGGVFLTMALKNLTR